MVIPKSHPIKRIIGLTGLTWNCPDVRASVQENYRKVQICGTPAMGGDVYRSKTDQKIVFYTCKSKCCPSCGNRATMLWQREQWAVLPDVTFVGIVLTMPDSLWPIFEAHRHLEHDLPALAASVVQEWAWTVYRVRLILVVVPHSFGGHLNHNPHIHMMASAGGLRSSDLEWIPTLKLNSEAIRELWRFAVTSYLWKAHRDGILSGYSKSGGIDELISKQVRRTWNIHITPRMTKGRFLAYAGRYVRRLPISQRRILSVTSTEVSYLSKDTKTKTFPECRLSPAEFIALLSKHVQDRYQHSMRYFGVMAPRIKNQKLASIFAQLGQRPCSKPRRESWAMARMRTFGIHPLVDKCGNRMHWVGYQKPI